MRTATLSGLCPILAVIVSAPACGPSVCWPAAKQVACGAPTGSAAIEGPAALELMDTAQVAATSCLATDGTCSVPPSFSIEAASRVPGGLHIYVLLPPIAGPASYTLPPSGPDSVRIDAQVYVSQAAPQTANLIPISGTIAIDRLDADGFRATFEMMLELADGRRVSVSGGNVALEGCHVETVPPYCMPVTD
jgi:hypothetical protein